MIRLGINVDHIATLRQARTEKYPNPIQAISYIESAGADNITCHLREDRRHIQDRDIFLLKDISSLPLNFEMAATDEMLNIAYKLEPQYVTLVPEKRQELTTERGLNLSQDCFKSLEKIIAKLKDIGAFVSLFVDATEASIKFAKELKAQAVEIHTGPFCEKISNLHSTKEKTKEVDHLRIIAQLAHSLDLQVHCGHGINYENAHFFQMIPELQEANIGHAIISRSIFVGLKEAVKDMKNLLNNPVFCPKEL